MSEEQSKEESTGLSWLGDQCVYRIAMAYCGLYLAVKGELPLWFSYQRTVEERPGRTVITIRKHMAVPRRPAEAIGAGLIATIAAPIITIWTGSNAVDGVTSLLAAYLTLYFCYRMFWAER